MTHTEDLLRFKNDRISSMENNITKLEYKIEFLEAQLEIAKQVTFNN